MYNLTSVLDKLQKKIITKIKTNPSSFHYLLKKDTDELIHPGILPSIEDLQKITLTYDRKDGWIHFTLTIESLLLHFEFDKTDYSFRHYNHEFDTGFDLPRITKQFLSYESRLLFKIVRIYDDYHFGDLSEHKMNQKILQIEHFIDEKRK